MTLKVPLEVRQVLGPTPTGYYRLRTGRTPLLVTGLSKSGRSVNFYYLTSGAEYEQRRSIEDFVPFTLEDGEKFNRIREQEGRYPMAFKAKTNLDEKKLFEVKRDGKDTAYGHRIAINSLGKWVIELRGSGECIVVAPEQCEEVLPYTVHLQPVHDNVNSGSSDCFHAIVPDGCVQVNDLVIAKVKGRRGVFCRVDAVNTKRRSALALQLLRFVPSSPIDLGDLAEANDPVFEDDEL